MINKILTMLTFFFLIVACSSHETAQDNALNDTTLLKSSSKIGATANPNKFLGLFQNISPKGLHIYTLDERKAGTKFKGKVIDKSFYSFLPYENMEDTSNHYYSCCKFPLNKTKIGLIVRSFTDIDHRTDSIDLLIWDKSLKKVVSSINIAKNYEESGVGFTQDGWFKDLNNDQVVDIITRYKEEGMMVGDASDDPDSLSVSEDSLFVLLYNQGEYKRSEVKIDKAKYELHCCPQVISK